MPAVRQTERFCRRRIATKLGGVMKIELILKPLKLLPGDVATLDYEAFYSNRSVSVPPTLSEVQAAFGFPAEAGAGRFGILDAGGAGTDVYFCACDGANWWFTAMT